MFDYLVASSIIIIVARLVGIPILMGLMIVLLFGVAWWLIGDE